MLNLEMLNLEYLQNYVFEIEIPFQLLTRVIDHCVSNVFRTKVVAILIRLIRSKFEILYL